MTSLDTTALRKALLDEIDLLADLYRSADPKTPIPTCPDWNLANLIAHVGGGNRWAAAMIADLATEFLEFERVPDIRRPRDLDAADRWLRAGARAVIDSIDTVGSDVPVWTPFGSARPAEWWVRRRLHEASVHRADALLALDRELDIAPEIAADGLSEFLEIVEKGPRFETPLDEGASLRLRAIDTDDTWTILRYGDTITWSDSQAPASLTVQGTAADLFLLLVRRTPADNPRVETSGDLSILTTWLERIKF
ncbi:maleylpyruvate isomerase family mycothiol-dependent enzyme [Nocardia sp. CA-135398]|uniref:maleylpyruvate isomerase family mycothiol-dependent enzyme n=1 Tax=Nocardia sp. CA-135398 TaxID=3239977 RepID=UPI003D996304